MRKRKFKKIETLMVEVGVDLNKIESLSRILLHCLRYEEDLKSWDTENLSSVLFGKLIAIKQKFNNIERIMKI
jgi:hypothetical protein